jgi:hypothetical protein
MLFEKPAKGIPEHLPDFLAWELTLIHAKSYFCPNFGLRFSLKDIAASL